MDIRLTSRSNRQPTLWLHEHCLRSPNCAWLWFKPVYGLRHFLYSKYLCRAPDIAAVGPFLASLVRFEPIVSPTSSGCATCWVMDWWSSLSKSILLPFHFQTLFKFWKDKFCFVLRFSQVAIKWKYLQNAKSIWNHFKINVFYHGLLGLAICPNFGSDSNSYKNPHKK